MDSLKPFFNEKDRFAKYCGIKILEVSGGFARAEMEISETHLNAAGTVHGGALFTLADFAFAAAVNARGKVALALEAHINYIKGISRGRLQAVAGEVSLNRKIGNYRIRIEDEAGELIALFQGTAYRKDQDLVFS